MTSASRSVGAPAMSDQKILDTVILLAKAEALEHFTTLLRDEGYYEGRDVKLHLFKSAQIYRKHASGE